jgi:four helix bundle protein
MREEGENNKGGALRAVQRSTFNVQRPTSKEETRAERAYDLEERLLEYAARIIRLADSLNDTKAANHVGGQLLRSGTSALPNHGEAQAAESRADFIHKFGICLKELRESRRWLHLIKRVPLVSKPEKLDPLIAETEELVRIFDCSIRTARNHGADGPTLREDPPNDNSWKLDVERWALNVEPPAGPVAYEPAQKNSKRNPRR